jgi:hypothetical protein
MSETTKSVDQRAFRNVIPIAVWTAIWLATLALVRFGADLWGSQPAMSWIALALNIAVGIGLIVVHARYLRRVDDLQRKILIDAMAVALGVGIVGAFGYGAASHAGLVADDLNMAWIGTLMCMVYAVASVAGTVRYR